MIQDGGTALIFASRASHIAIVEYLVQHGISAGNITTKGYGESQPVNDCTEERGCTEAEYAKNRRSVITFTTMEVVED